MATQTTLTTPKKRTASGTILETRSKGLYVVKMEAGFNILAHIGSTMRKFSIRILPGDSVKVELSPFDIRRGKIVNREN